MIKVIKRNGSIVPFDKSKIIKSINSAFKEVDGELKDQFTANDIADSIEQELKITTKQALIEEIQDLIEIKLMSSGRKDVARAYIRYRYKQEVARGFKSDFEDAIAEKLGAKNVVNQNANVDEYSFGGRLGEATDVMTKQYALNNIVSKMSKYNHEHNIIYIHDLSHYAVGDHNCLSIPFDKLLAKGFDTRQTDIRPAASINTAFQLIAVVFQLQSLQQFGGVSSTHLDWTMVPYVRKSFYKHYKDGLLYIADLTAEEAIKELKSNEINNSSHILDSGYNNEKVYKYALAMTEKEVHQSVEAFFHNLNTLQSRSGN